MKITKMDIKMKYSEYKEWGYIINMNQLIKRIKEIFLSREFILFLIVGVINTFNGTIFASIYSIFLNENVAFVLGYISSLIISYILNSFITFKEKLEVRKFIKFAISYIPNFIIQNIVVIIVFNILNYDKIIAYILAAIIGVPVTFILMKFFTFRHNWLFNICCRMIPS